MGSDGVATTPVSPLQQLCEQAKVSDEAKALLNENSSTKEFLALLTEQEMFRDAIRLYAYLLPKREAIGWGCLCMRHALAGMEGKPLSNTQLAAERWVSSPAEENRWAAKQEADIEDPKTASSFLALAVFFAGHSMSPPHCQPIPPANHLTPLMVASGVILAGVDKDPEKAKKKYLAFMQKASALITRMQQPQQ